MSDIDFEKLTRALDRVKSKVFMGSASAFYAPLMSSLGFRWENCETAATDHQNIYWDPEFFQTAPKKYGSETFNEFVLQHELEHNARLHNLRQGNRCPDVWNYACDVRINNDLKLLGFNWGTFPAWYRPEFDVNGRMDEEAIYELLNKQGFKVPQSPWGPGGDMIGGTDNASAQKSLNSVVRAITNAKMEGKPGAIPGNLESIVDRFLKPVVPWEAELIRWHTDLQDEDFSWSRPNRRYTEMYLPSRFEDEGRLAHLIWFQDVSGSITDQSILRFNSELKYVWDRFRPIRMTIVQFDTIIQKVDEINEGDEFNKIVITGRGGTNLEPVREYIVQHRPTGAIIFSDMQVSPMEKLPYDIPVLWVAEGRHGHKPTFGKTIYLPRENQGVLR